MNTTTAKRSKKSPARGRPSKAGGHLDRLKALGLFRVSQAKKSGVPQQTLSRLVAAGQVLRLSRGIYRHPDTQIDPADEDFAIAGAKFGARSAIGGLTALFHYHLTDQPPQQIWILVPPNRTTSDPRYRCMRVNAKLGTGVETRDNYRIVSIERSVAEGLKFASKIGIETAIRAARNAFKQKLTTPANVLKTARALKIERFVMNHWEAITVE